MNNNRVMFQKEFHILEMAFNFETSNLRNLLAYTKDICVHISVFWDTQMHLL